MPAPTIEARPQTLPQIAPQTESFLTRVSTTIGRVIVEGGLLTDQGMMLNPSTPFTDFLHRDPDADLHLIPGIENRTSPLSEDHVTVLANMTHTLASREGINTGKTDLRPLVRAIEQNVISAFEAVSNEDLVLKA